MTCLVVSNLNKIYDKNAITAMYFPEESNLKITCILEYMKNCNRLQTYSRLLKYKQIIFSFPKN